MTLQSSARADALLHTIVCDLDDTLYAEADYVLSGFRVVDRWLTTKLGLNGLLPVATTLFEQGERGKIFDVALRELGRTPSAELVAEMVQVYREHRPQIRLCADAESFLEKVTGQYRLGLLTDGYQGVQQRKVEALGIASRFACVVFTDALGRDCWKPHPGGFLRLMEMLPGEPAGYLYVGDNPRKDFIAPRQLGWKTVRIRRSLGEHASYEPTPAEAADREVTSLLHLQGMLEIW